MATSKSTAMKNAIAQGYGAAEVLDNGCLYLYGGARPANADAEPGSSPVVVVTDTGATYVQPVRASANIAMTAVNGTINTIKVGGSGYNLIESAVTITAASMAASIQSLVDAINNRKNPHNIVAAVGAGNSIDLFAPYAMADGANGLTLTATATGPVLTVSSTFTGGTAPTAGLRFQLPAVSGVLSKKAAQTWKGVALSGTLLTWFRFVAPGSTPTGAGSGQARLDGSVGIDMTATPSASVVQDAAVNINSFSVTIS